MNGVPDIYPDPSKPIPVKPISPPILPTNTTPDIKNSTVVPITPPKKILPNPSPIVPNPKESDNTSSGVPLDTT